MTECNHKDCKDAEEMKDIQFFQEKITAFLETLQPEAKARKVAVVVLLNQKTDNNSRMGSSVNVGHAYAREILKNALISHFPMDGAAQSLADVLKKILGLDDEKRAV